MIALSKFYNDFYVSNKFMATSIGASLRLVNELEKVFLRMIDYNVYVK